MQFLKNIRPLEAIASIVERNKQKFKDNKTAKTIESKEKETQKIAEQPSPKAIDHQPAYEEAQSFLISLRKAADERQQEENIVRRKINLFQKVQIEPHYLSPADDVKLLNFEFQLGSDIFLDRVQNLHDQVTQINSVIKEVLSTRKHDALRYLESVDDLYNYVLGFIERLKQHRAKIKTLKEHHIYKIQKIVKRKNIIKQKIRLLKLVKTKNQAAFLQITNIDQAFATEHSRTKLYKKINKLTQLEKSKYVGIIKEKLVSVSRRNKEMVEEGIKKWLEGKLSDKQIEKLTVMIYFMEREDIYKDHDLQLDFNKLDKAKLKKQVKKIFEWKSFTYVKDMMTKDRIHEFLNYLLKKLD